MPLLRRSHKVFLKLLLYESLGVLFFSPIVNDNVYMYAVQHWFVLLEKFGDNPFSNGTVSHIGGIKG